KLFVNVLQSKTSDQRHKQFALNGLIGVYANSNRPVDQLWAAFQSALLARERDWEHYYEISSAGLNSWVDLDIAYLLDVQLTDSELWEYLDRFPDTGKRLGTIYPRERTPGELVRYALAVRHARREEYSEAATIYQGLLASSRAQRMRSAARLAEAARDMSVSIELQLQAQYNYAVFLANNSDAIFFNDSIWNGIQTWTFQIEAGQVDAYTPALSRQEAMSPEQANRFKQLERKV